MEQMSFIEQENVDALHTHTHTSIPLNVKFHCFFEQSGTFKNEFKKLGYNAYDYDILNDFGETDYVIDLFSEIEKAYEGKESIFDTIGKEDYILAFFPCVRFENQIMLWFRGQSLQQQNWTYEQKMEKCMELQDELTHNYKLVNKMFIVCIRKGLKIIMENPFSEEHYLRRYWCLLPGVIDRDRRTRGDYFKKPTQYWFMNCKPTFRPLFETTEDNFIGVKDAIRNMGEVKEQLGTDLSQTKVRSMIHKDYANRFIREFIL